MKTSKLASDPAVDDADLVNATLDGDPNAYEQIVTRYQSLICSLAYSATGRIDRSEDIAQETFVTAWRQLSELRDPASLRPWLCGIARNLINNSRRSSGREPAEIGDPFEPGREFATDEISPPEEISRNEEEAILWRSLGRIPETYREPLILYYREGRSVAQVAGDLGLTEDATKQRLLRGRALLQEQVTAFIEGTLERTKPGAAFTSGVMAALPLIGASAAALVATPSAKAATAAKAAAVGGSTGFSGIVAIFASLAGFVGWQMSDSPAQTLAEREAADRFWRFIVISLAVIVGPTFLTLMLWKNPPHWAGTALSWWLGVVYFVTGLPFAAWAWRNHRRVHPSGSPAGRRTAVFGFAWVTLLLVAIASGAAIGFPSGRWTDLWLELVFILLIMPVASRGLDWMRTQVRPTEPSGARQGESSGKSSLIWVAVATCGMAALLGFSLVDMKGWQTQRITATAARELMLSHRDAALSVLEYQSGAKALELVVPGIEGTTGNSTRYIAPLNESTQQALNDHSIPYRVLRQGEDFERLGTPGRMLSLLSFMVTIAGLVVLARGARHRTGRPLIPAEAI